MALKDRRYTRTHEWLLVRGTEALVGITDHAADALGDVTFVDLPAQGREIAQGQPFGVIESVKAVSDLISPLDGVIVAVNPAVDAEPELVNRAPYGEGWLIRVSIGDPSQVDALLSPAEYEAFLEEQKG